MAKTSKINQIINEIVNTEWLFFTKRPDMPPLPVWHKIKPCGFSKEHKKIYGVNIPWACFWYDNDVEFYLHGKEYSLAIRKATEILYSKQKFNNHLSRLKQTCYEVKKLVTVFNNKHWKSYNNKQLFKIYTHIVNKYALSFIYGFIRWCTQVLQHDANIIINSYHKALNKINISPDQALGILIVPDKTTVYQEKKEELAKLSKKYRRILSEYKDEKFLSSNYSKLYAEIKKFIKKYYWVGFNYIGPVLDYNTALKELLQSRDRIQSELPTKKEIYKVCRFSEKEKYVFYALEMASYATDLRNATEDYVHYCFSNFYNEAAKRIGLIKKDIHFLWDDELNKLLTEKYKITPQYIQKKQKFCAALTAPESVGVKQYYIGKEARHQRENIFRHSNLWLRELSYITIKGKIVIKGTIASTGTATGTVKIIHNISEVEKVKKGDILVVGMTSPKYMSAILNSSAIITDDGGLTCHAAIVARELQKPCIIGTKIATKVLRDGQMVEVDANKGVVKIIKQ